MYTAPIYNIQLHTHKKKVAFWQGLTNSRQQMMLHFNNTASTFAQSTQALGHLCCLNPDAVYYFPQKYEHAFQCLWNV